MQEFLNHGGHREHRDTVPVEFAVANKLTEKIIDSCITVHERLGPGLLESVYQKCLAYECGKRGLIAEIEKSVPLIYDDLHFETAFKADMIINNSIIIELKTVEKVLPVHEAQILTYMRLTGLKVGLLINFNARLIKDGIKRYVL